MSGSLPATSVAGCRVRLGWPRSCSRPPRRIFAKSHSGRAKVAYLKIVSPARRSFRESPLGDSPRRKNSSSSCATAWHRDATSATARPRSADVRRALLVRMTQSPLGRALAGCGKTPSGGIEGARRLEAASIIVVALRTMPLGRLRALPGRSEGALRLRGSGLEPGHAHEVVGRGGELQPAAVALQTHEAQLAPAATVFTQP